MRIRYRIVLFALLGATFCISVGMLWPRPIEPVYHGKTLSEWLKKYPEAAVRQFRYIPNVEADTAIQGMGTNAIPTLLGMLRAKDSELKKMLRRVSDTPNAAESNFIPAYTQQARALCGFGALRATANNAVPDLVRIIQEHVSDYSQMAAVQSLGFIGPSASNAVPALLPLTVNGSRDVRVRAIVALGQIHAQPEVVIRQLLLLQLDPDIVIQAKATEACNQFDPETVTKVSMYIEKATAASK